MTVARHPLVNGKPIRFRALQQALWGVGLGTLVFGLFASGIYFGPTQVHWYIHIGSFYWPGFWLKKGWDDGMGLVGTHTWLINSANWAFFRHAYRNIGLPALATMGALSVTGGARKPASRWYTAIAPLLVLATAVVLITAGVYGTLRLNSAVGTVPTWATALEAGALGLVIGQILHFIWRPAGTRIQSFLVEKAVDRHWRSSSPSTPAWVSHPLTPPTFREAAWQLMEADVADGEAGRLAAEGRTRAANLLLVAVAAGAVLVLGVDFVGFIGHIWDGVFHLTFPYLAP